jgi:rhodanese-related sulfurtransferase
MRYIIFVLTLAVIGCSTEKKETTSAVEQSADEGGELSPEKFQDKLQSEPDAVLLDVRTPDETAEGVIAGATLLNFKDDDFEQRIDSLAKDKTYFVYCASGGRSGKASSLMKEKGFHHVYTLEGGLTTWKEKGLPIAIQK